MNLQELAKKLAIELKTIRAERYDLVLREFDDKVELIGYTNDPNYSLKDFEGREMLFPKRWLTLEVLDADRKVKV